MMTGGGKNQSESKKGCLRKWFRSVCGSAAVFLVQAFWSTREEHTCLILAWPTFPIRWACLAAHPADFPGTYHWRHPNYPLGNLLMHYWDNRGKALLQGKRFVCVYPNRSTTRRSVWPQEHPIVKFLQCDVQADPVARVEK